MKFQGFFTKRYPSLMRSCGNCFWINSSVHCCDRFAITGKKRNVSEDGKCLDKVSKKRARRVQYNRPNHGTYVRIYIDNKLFFDGLGNDEDDTEGGELTE